MKTRLSRVWLVMGLLQGFLLQGFLLQGFGVPGRAQEPDRLVPSALQTVLAMEKVMVEAIAKAEKSVVAIARVRKGGRNVRTPDDFGNGLPLIRPQLFGLPDAVPTSPDFVPNEFATGVVIDNQGHIVTNYHALGNPDENDYFVWVQRKPYQVTRVEVPERVEAGDPWTDLAVLTVSAEDLQPIAFGDASALRKGMIVIALGNPFGIARDGEVSASWGIISNLRRATVPPPQVGSRSEAERDSLHQFGTLIQTDARLNLGTSGGALVNLRGEMVGLTTSLTALTGYEQPAGYAIPVDASFHKTLETLKQGRLPAFGFLGVQPEHLSVSQRQSGHRGARVLRVVPGSPADLAGIKQEDVITHVDGQQVDDRNGLFRELSKRSAETRVSVTYERRDPLFQRSRASTVNVTLSKKFIPGARPPYSLVAEPTWRGLRIDYPSALPPHLNSLAFETVDRQACVAVLDVTQDSPAWKAGFRPGEFISHVEDRRVATPRDFYAAVANLQGDVRLQLTTSRGNVAQRTVPN